MRFLAAAALAVLLVLPATAAEEPVNEAIAWVMRDNIRMGWGPPTLDHYDSMRAAGMNAVMPRIELGAVVDYDSSTAAEPLYEGDGAALKALRDTSRKAKEAGLRYFHCLDIAAQHQTAAVGFQDNPARHNDGRAPSPIDPVFWRRSIIQRVDRALDLLDGDAYALDAVIVDPEMYTIHGWSPGGPDYGAYAFQRFLDETGKQAPAGLDSVQTRKEWLETSALIPAYEQWQYDCIVALARELRDLVHARRPNVILGFILYTNQMWYNAMIEGLYSPGLPVFVGPETTYSGVMDESFVAFARSVRADSPKPILFAPGVRMGLEDGRVPTEYLKVIPGNLYQRCQYSEGYWVWAIYRFGDAEQQEQFFGALAAANAGLDRQAATGKLDETLKAAPLPVDLPVGLDERLRQAQTFRPVDESVPQSPMAYAAPRLRGTHTVLLWPQPGQNATLTVRARKLGALLAPTAVRIFDPQGREVWSETIPIGDARVLRIPDAGEGAYAAVISAGGNAYQIADATCPAMIAQGKEGIHVNARGMGGRFYFLVPPETPKFTMHLRAHAVEKADFTLRAPKGDIILHRVALDGEYDHVQKSPEHGIWSIEANNMIDDAWFFLSGLPNHLSLRSGDIHTTVD